MTILTLNVSDVCVDKVAVLSKMVSECVESVGRSTALLPKQ